MYTTLNFPSIYDDVFYLQVQNTLGSDPDGELSRKVRKLKTKVKTLTTTLNRLVSRLARDSCASNPCKYDHTSFTSSSCMFLLNVSVSFNDSKDGALVWKCEFKSAREKIIR